MRKRGVCLIIIMILIGGTVGVSAADGSWAAGNMPACCKKAKATGTAPEVSMARICCKLNCSEPGSSGSNGASNLSRNQGTTSTTAIVPVATNFSRAALRSLQSQLSQSRNSNPKYIKHLALLI